MGRARKRGRRWRFYLVSLVPGVAIAAIMFSLFTAVTLDQAGGKDQGPG
jgi:hypothetical protein